jgi:outer membrane protein insertion porin family
MQRICLFRRPPVARRRRGRPGGDPDRARPLLEVRVEGTTTFADIVRTIVAARRGTQAERVDLEAERNRVYALGTFEEVSVTLEDRGAGPVLIVRVRENPAVAAVEVVGGDAARRPPAARRDRGRAPARPGAHPQRLRAEQAVGTLQADLPLGRPALRRRRHARRGAGGRRAARERSHARSACATPVDESAPLRRVVFEPSSVLSESELEAIFRGMTEPEASTSPPTGGGGRRRRALHRGGPPAERRRPGALDARERPAHGPLPRAAHRRLRHRGARHRPVGAQPARRRPLRLRPPARRRPPPRRRPLGRRPHRDARHRGGAVRVRFAVGAPDTAGPIDRVVVEGNTRIDDETLIASVRADGVGTPSPRRWPTRTSAGSAPPTTPKGVVIDARPSYNYLDGTYVQRVTELRIAGYELVYDGAPGRTEERVVTRYLPAPGELVDLRRIDEGLRQVARLGVVTPVNRILVPTEAPGEVVVELLLRSNSTGLLQPGRSTAPRPASPPASPTPRPTSGAGAQPLGRGAGAHQRPRPAARGQRALRHPLARRPGLRPAGGADEPDGVALLPRRREPAADRRRPPRR